MTRTSKVSRHDVQKAVFEGKIRGGGGDQFVMFPRWVDEHVGSVASKEMLNHSTEFSHLAFGYYPVYRLKGSK